MATLNRSLREALRSAAKQPPPPSSRAPGVAPPLPRTTVNSPRRPAGILLVVVFLVLVVLGSRCSEALELEEDLEGSTRLGARQTSPEQQHQQHQQHGATGSSTQLYQPALIGIRCAGWRDDGSGAGLSVVEANKPFLLTLFGESFTRNTIVAFTTEFREEQVLPAAPTANRSASSRKLGDQRRPNAGEQPARFGNRLRTRSRSYDCTDYNRVVSYKLGPENILSPNVASIRVTLPELAPGSEQYYYFCLKQPRLFLEAQSEGAASSLNAGSQQVSNNGSSPASESLVWVHQGNEWWVTIKVEPPMLTLTNDCILIVVLLCLSAVTSGLNLGLMSLDMNELAVIGSSGDQRERSYARTIAPLRKRGNFLLCSLLLGNVMVNSTLTVILEEMTSGLVAVIASTLAIVVLGEIVPQALCARHGLAIGARTIYLTYGFMLLTFPVSYPISCLLDYVLGEEKGNVYDRERLMEFIKITGHHTQLEADEVAIISGALKLKKIKVEQIMTRIEDVFMLPLDCELDRDTIRSIIMRGYSRVPVYEFNNRKQIVALILAKDLALLDPDDRTPIANMLQYCKHPLIFIEDDTTLDVALNVFKTGKSHMAVVRQIYDDGEVDKYYEAIGVVTLEDVIEEVLQAEINDETDTLSDNRRKRRRTDAQLALDLPLIDELTTCKPTSASKPQPLSSQLIPIRLDSVARSLGGAGSGYPMSLGQVSPGAVEPSSDQGPNEGSLAGSSLGEPLVIGGPERSNQSSEQLMPAPVSKALVASGTDGGGGGAGATGGRAEAADSSGSWQTQNEAGVLSRAAQFFSNIMP